MRFTHGHIFPFSPRAGTAAAGFDGQVPKDGQTRGVRDSMHLAVARTAEMERRRFVGSIRPVLWEGSGQQLTDQA